MKPPFENPFLKEPSLTPINFSVPSDDYNYLKSLRPRNGTLTTTFSIIFQRLIHELKRQNITTATYESFINGAVIISHGSDVGLSNGPTGRPLSATDAPDDGRGTTNVRSTTTPEAPRVPNLQSGSGSGGEGETREKSVGSRTKGSRRKSVG